MGEEDISSGFRAKLEQELNNFQAVMAQTLDSFNHWSNHYSQRMQDSLNGVEYLSGVDFLNLHQNIRSEAISQVRRFF